MSVGLVTGSTISVDHQTSLWRRIPVFSVHFYSGVNHGFHNDTTPRFDEDAATLAWDRTLVFFDTHLR